MFTLDSGELLVVDIGTTGRLLRAAPKDEVAKDTQVVVSFTQGGQLRMADAEGVAEAFVVTPDLLVEEVPELADLGLDPVASPVSWTAFAQSLVNHRNEKLKPLLMDQSFVVGLGGLYADEILHDAGLRPDREVSTVSTMEIRRLYRSLVEILHEATKHHGTSHRAAPVHRSPGQGGQLPGRAAGVGPRRRAVPAVPPDRDQAAQRRAGHLLVPELPGLILTVVPPLPVASPGPARRSPSLVPRCSSRR